MPDIWTKHPEIVRSLLEEAGFTCGAEPRVLKGRDPAWTCIVDGKAISGDLYIHHVDELLGAKTHMGLGGGLIVAVGLALLLSKRLPIRYT